MLFFFLYDVCRLRWSWSEWSLLLTILFGCTYTLRDKIRRKKNWRRCGQPASISFSTRTWLASPTVTYGARMIYIPGASSLSVPQSHACSDSNAWHGYQFLLLFLFLFLVFFLAATTTKTAEERKTKQNKNKNKKEVENAHPLQFVACWDRHMHMHVTVIKLSTPTWVSLTSTNAKRNTKGNLSVAPTYCVNVCQIVFDLEFLENLFLSSAVLQSSHCLIWLIENSCTLNYAPFFVCSIRCSSHAKFAGTQHYSHSTAHWKKCKFFFSLLRRWVLHGRIRKCARALTHYSGMYFFFSCCFFMALFFF